MSKVILYLKFKLSNQIVQGLFVQSDNVIFRRVSLPVPGFRAGVATLILSQHDIKFISRDVPREQHAMIEKNEKMRQ